MPVNRLIVLSCKRIKRPSSAWKSVDIVMSPENDAGDVDCNVEGCYPCWRWLSRLGLSRNTNGRADANMTCWVRRDLKPTKRKAVTFALEWNDKYEACLCEWCRDHVQQYYHDELCGTCGALFTINRPWVDAPNIGLAHGTSSAVLEECVTRSGQC